MPAKIVEIIDVQLIGGQQALSRYHYLDADGVADEAGLVGDFLEFVVPATAAFQTTQVQHVALRHRQVYPTALLVQEVPISPAVSGANGSAAGPPNASISIKFGLGDTTYLTGGTPPHIRKGGKHFPGVDLLHMDPEALMDATYNALVATWFTQASRPVGDPWGLVVVSFELTRSHTVDTAATRTITKAQQSPTVTKYAPVLSASVPSVSTQNTRKVLRGRTY
jgi:hypothetical protein